MIKELHEDKTRLAGWTKKPGQTFIQCYQHGGTCLYNDEENRCRTNYITNNDGTLGCYFPVSKLLDSLSIRLNLYALDDPERQNKMKGMREMLNYDKVRCLR